MIFFDRIQDSLQFIEDHLDQEFSLEDVAKASGISLSHFYKMMLASTGFTVKEYIRNKRLARAASQLVRTKRRIIDIAVDAGFNSHEVFTRAFTQLYGISPKDYRMNRKEIPIFEKHVLFGKEIEKNYQQLKGHIGIHVKTIDSDAMVLVGMELRTSVRDTIEKGIIPLFWRDRFVPRLSEIKHIKQPYVSVAYEIHHPETDALYHMACVEAADQNVPDGMTRRIVAMPRYAVFATDRALNPIEYGVLTQYIYGEWLPMSGHVTLSDFTMDMNYAHSYYSDQYYTQALQTGSRLEVYVPIR